MKKLLLILTFLLPLSASAAFAVPFNATSTTQGWVFPTRVNGVEQTIVGQNFVSTSTVLTNLFPILNGTSITGYGLTTCNGSQFLQWAAGLFGCATPSGGGGGTDTNWSFFNGSGIRPATTTNQVLIGASSTSTLSKLEVVGGLTFDNATGTQLRIGDGAVNLPSVSFANDNDTGLYLNGANGLGLSGGGAGLTWNGTAFYPNTTATRELGRSGNTWLNFWGVNSTTTNATTTNLYASNSLSVGPYVNMLASGVINLGYSPISMYQDAFGSLVHLTGNPGYYFPRMLNVNYAPPDNTANDLGDQEAGASYELPVNGGCFNGTSFACAQGIEMGAQRYTKNGNNYYSNVNYINSYKRSTGTSSPIAISFENKDNGSFETRYIAQYLDPSGAVAIGGYASTSSNSSNRYDVGIPLQVASSTATTTFAVDSTPRNHLFVVNSNGNVGIGTSSPSNNLVILGTAGQNTIEHIVTTGTGNTGELRFSATGASSAGFTIKRYGSAIGSGLNNTAELWNFESTGNSGIRIGGSGGEAVRIDTINGRVGIGTVTPQSPLDVQGLASTTNLLVVSSSTLQNFTFVNATGSSATTTNFFSTKASTSALFIATGVCSGSNALNVNASGQLVCGAVSGTGGGTNTDKFATTTSPDTNGIYTNSATRLGIGTTTPRWTLQLASSTSAQLALSDGSLTSFHWLERNAGGNLYFASASPSTFASTSISSLSIINGGVAGAVGIGTDNPFGVNANSRLVVAGVGSQDIIASTTDDTASSDAIVQAYAAGSRVFLGAHGASQVTTQYGITVGGWGEVAAINSSLGTSNGLLIGTRTTNAPIVLGTNSVERFRVGGDGFSGFGTTTPKWLLQLASSTRPQLALSDGIITDNHWTLRSVGNNLYFATASPSTFATSSASALTIDTNGQLTIPFYAGTGCAQFGAGGLLSNTGVACGTGGGSTNTDKFATSSTANAIYPNAADKLFVGLTSGGTAKVEIQGSSTAATEQALLVWNSLGATGPILSALNNRTVGVATSTPTSPLTVATTTLVNAAFPIGLSVGPNGLTSGSANGTLIGGNTQAGFTGNLLDFQINGTDELAVSSAGTLTANGNLIAAAGGNLQLNGRSIITSASDGVTELSNNANTGFTRLQFGGTTSAFPGLGIAGQKLFGLLADGTNGGFFGFGTSTPQWTLESSSSTAPQLVLDNTAGGTNAQHLAFNWTGSELRIGTTSDSTFTSTSTALRLVTNALPSIAVGSTTVQSVLTIGTASGFPTGTAGASTTQLAYFGFVGSSTPSLAIESANNNGKVLIATTTNAANTNAVLAIGGKIWLSNQLTITGTVGDVCLNATGEVQVNPGAANCTVSARRYKTDILDSTLGLDALNKIDPVTFTYKSDGTKKIGFIADDLATIDNRLGVFLPDGQIQSFDEAGVLSITVKAVQELEARGVKAARSAEENWQWFAIGILAAWNLYLTFRKK